MLGLLRSETRATERRVRSKIETAFQTFHNKAVLKFHNPIPIYSWVSWLKCRTTGLTSGSI